MSEPDAELSQGWSGRTLKEEGFLLVVALQTWSVMWSEVICLRFPPSHTHTVQGPQSKPADLAGLLIASCGRSPLAEACLYLIKCCFLLFLTMATTQLATTIPLQCLNSRTWRGDSSFKFVLSWVLSFSPRNGFSLVSTIITKKSQPGRC